MKIEKIAVVTNYNIPDKLAAAIAVSEKLSTHIKEVFVPENYKDRIFRSHNHRSCFTYLSYDEIYAKVQKKNSQYQVDVQRFRAFRYWE